jgi:hypothetical protein
VGDIVVYDESIGTVEVHYLEEKPECEEGPFLKTSNLLIFIRMRIIEINHPRDLKQTMQDIKVDNYGIKIMIPKAVTYLVKIDSLSCIAANILKQEILSLGGDAAIARDALTGKTSQTDCLLMGTLAQLQRLMIN